VTADTAEPTAMPEPTAEAAEPIAPRRPRVATVWLDGCSGCHMSLLDMDERILDIFDRADLVYGPLVDVKEFPLDVDVCLVEGAVSSEEDLHKVRLVRERTKTLVAFGDCAVTSNVPGMRNPIGPLPLLERAYLENVAANAGIPTQVVPALLPMASPVHSVVNVDVFLPGCPPSADLIYSLLDDLLSGRQPEVAGARFGR
jgi:NAD-reducing hydrogenase small subunit